jgi:pyrroline-5-carboxylate reductase
MISQTIGFIGAGQMAQALARGFLAAGLVEARQLVAADPVRPTLEAFCSATPGARPLADNRQVVEAADVVLLAVKPQQVAAVAEQLGGRLDPAKLLVSIAAGMRLKTLADLLHTQRLVRVMPNTPCLVGCGASGYSLGPGATPADAQLVRQLLESVGKAFLVSDEKLLDAVTGLSGSGPAFVYVMIEALSDGGVRMGLPRDVAAALAAQTVRGAAEMVLVTGEHPAALKDRVTSPGGTTIAGLQALEVGAVRAALMAAVEAATRRSTELGGA